MIISEFLPNPIGKDTEGEWIELFNNSQEAVDLSGWQIKDASGKAFFLKNKIGPGQYSVLDYKTTKISLNNNAETLFLYDQKGNLIDKVEFAAAAPEGKSLVRQNEQFRFTDQPTPGFANVFKNAAVSELTTSKNSLTTNVLTNTSVNNSSINSKVSAHFGNLLIGVGVALILAFLFVFILRKLNLLSD